MKQIDISGGQFVVDGTPRPIRTFSNFSMAVFLTNWATGKGGEWLDRVERYMERKVRQGADALRTFGETRDWDDRDDNPDNDHPFFNAFRTSADAWDYNALARGQRPERLNALNAQVIAKMIDLCYKHDVWLEYDVDATLKHSRVPIPWGAIGHCIRQTAAFLHAIESDAAPDGFETWPTHVQKHVENVMGRRVPFLFELHNEWDAHSRQSWLADDDIGDSYEKALAELNLQLGRVHRFKDGIPEQWPNAIFGVSHGGRDTVDYDGHRASYIAIHPNRGGEWSRVGNRFDDAKQYQKPVYLNETKHYIDPAWWDRTINEGWFSVNSSTQNAERLLRFAEDATAQGMSFCFHGLVEMASGIWEDLTEMPLTPLELELIGNAPPPPPPPPPPPEERLRFEGIVTGAYVEILGRAPDLDGLMHYNDQLWAGMTKAELEESLMRSDEFNRRNPEERLT